MNGVVLAKKEENRRRGRGRSGGSKEKEQEHTPTWEGGWWTPIMGRHFTDVRFLCVRLFMSDPSSARFVLIETSHPGNVGAAARAMKVMGFTDLVLVRPRYSDVLSREETVAMASGAADVLTRARIADTLAEALDGVQVACATAMTPRDFGPPTHAPRAWFPRVASAGHRIGFVFGSERYGMANEDVYRCHAALSIPTAPGYGSLNLAQAVQVVAYEWRQALGGFDVQAKTAIRSVAADVHAIQGMLTHLEQALIHVGFLDPLMPKKLIPRLNQLCNRVALTPEEVHILRGMAKAMLECEPRRQR